MLHFGDQLKTVRQARGYSLEQLEDITGINAAYLNILERGRYDELPEDNVTVEIVSRYAAALGICVADAVDDWRADRRTRSRLLQQKNIVQPLDADESQRGLLCNQPAVSAGLEGAKAFLFRGMPVIHIRSLVAAGVFLLAVLWLGAFIVGPIISSNVNAYMDTSSVRAEYDHQRLEDIKQAQPSRGEESQVELSAPVPGTSASLTEADSTISLELLAEQDCWVKTTVDGEVAYEGILVQGQRLTMVGQEVIRLKTSSAGSLSLTFNGEALKVMGDVNEVIEKEFR